MPWKSTGKTFHHAKSCSQEYQVNRTWNFLTKNIPDMSSFRYVDCLEVLSLFSISYKLWREDLRLAYTALLHTFLCNLLHIEKTNTSLNSCSRNLNFHQNINRTCLCDRHVSQRIPFFFRIVSPLSRVTLWPFLSVTWMTGWIICTFPVCPPLVLMERGQN